MTPLRTTELAIQFAARLAPGWLALLLPLALATGWWLYRRDRRVLGRSSAAALPAVRCLLLATLVFLAFRPSLVWREILTYPSRLLLLLDDSASMAVADPQMAPGEALLLHRRLHGALPAVPQPFHDLARMTVELGDRLQRFQPQSRQADRTHDAFWALAEATAAEVDQWFELWQRESGTIVGLPEEDRQRLGAINLAIAELVGRCRPLFVGDRHPGAAAYEALYTTLREQETRLLGLQAALDMRAEGAGGEAVAAAIRGVRQATRVDLLAAAMRQYSESLPKQFPDRRLELARLGDRQTVPLAAFTADLLRGSGGSTDLAGRVVELLDGDNEFPLAGVVVVSDGADLSSVPTAELVDLAVRRQVPLFGAWVGTPLEPTDLALIEAIAPPVAVQGQPLTVRIQAKTAVPTGTELTIRLLAAQTSLAERKLVAAGQPHLWTELTFTPEELGVQRYTVAIASVDGEVVPQLNNARDIAIQVRERPVSVLLLDWKPRWESRFALNILRRLPYVDLNPIIVLVAPDGELPRGVRKGAWPADRATLEMVDLIIVGDLPPGTLSTAEWDDLAQAVEERGKTLFFLAGDGGLADDAGLRQRLLPRQAIAPAAGQLDEARLTGFGARHPLTRAMAPLFGILPDAPLEPPVRAGQSLALNRPAGAPLVATRLAGRGRTALLAHPELWRRLNPLALEAHADLFVNLVSWAVCQAAGDQPAGQPPATDVRLDALVYTTGQAMQAWVEAPPPGAAIEAWAAGQAVATAAVEAAPGEADFGWAVLAGLPAGELTLQLPTAVSTPVLQILERNPELDFLAAQPERLRRWAADTGGAAGSFAELPRLLSRLPARDRVEKNERIVRLWDARWLLALLVLGLTVEWVWRKWVGLV